MGEVSSDILDLYDLSMNEAAEMMRISRSTIIRWRVQAYGPQPIHYGRIWLYSSREIEDWIKGLVKKEYGHD